MQTIQKAKLMAKRLRALLATSRHDISYSAALELVAQQLGYRDWNTASAQLRDDTQGIVFERSIPILRMFDEGKAREFYCDFLGFSVEFEHRFEANLPLYLGLERAGLKLHLSEHHGDASPGATIFVPMRNIAALHDELIGKHYSYGRPNIVEQDWGQEMQVHDPFGNRIRFCQY